MCLESLIRIATKFSKEENQVHTLGTLLAAAEDQSWKVRLCFAKSYSKFAEAYGKDLADSNLIQTFVGLLSDSEPEVKNAAVHSLSNSIKNTSPQKLADLVFPALAAIYTDSQTSFKSGCATALCEMAGIVGHDFTNGKIVPILMELSKDDNAEVRLNVINRMKMVYDVVQADLLTPTFLKQLETLSKDS